MADDELHIVVFNKTLQSRRFIVYQQDVSLDVDKYLIYAWNNRLLANGGAFWFFTLPLSFQVAGINGNPEDYSSTNIEKAEYGQRWELTQREDEAFMIELSDITSEPDNIKLINTITFARRTVVLMKRENPLIGCELPADGGDVNFKIEPSFYLALSDEYKRGDIINVSKVKNPYKVSCQWHKSVAQFQISVTEDPISGKITFQTEYMPRTAYHDACLPNSLAANADNGLIEQVDKTHNLKNRRRVSN